MIVNHEDERNIPMNHLSFVTLVFVSIFSLSCEESEKKNDKDNIGNRRQSENVDVLPLSNQNCIPRSDLSGLSFRGVDFNDGLLELKDGNLSSPIVDKVLVNQKRPKKK